jgi:hypothetical protein
VLHHGDLAPNSGTTLMTSHSSIIGTYQQRVPHSEHVLAYDPEAVPGQQVIVLVDGPTQRVFNRNHPVPCVWWAVQCSANR